MQWDDEALILSVRPHGETAAIVEVLTRAHGRYLGLVHGARSRRNRPVLQIGNQVDVTWKARLAEHLGHMAVELRHGYAAEVMGDRLALAGLSALTAMARLLPERDPHPNLYEVSMFVMGFLSDTSVWPALYVRWELALLEELGFALDLAECAATGAREELVYVSPRTGRAVSRDAGQPYAERMLPLPPFLLGNRRAGAIEEGDELRGLELTGHFIERRVLQPRELTFPEARRELVRRLTKG